MSNSPIVVSRGCGDSGGSSSPNFLEVADFTIAPASGLQYIANGSPVAPAQFPVCKLAGRNGFAVHVWTTYHYQVANTPTSAPPTLALSSVLTDLNNNVVQWGDPSSFQTVYNPYATVQGYALAINRKFVFSSNSDQLLQLLVYWAAPASPPAGTFTRGQCKVAVSDPVSGKSLTNVPARWIDAAPLPAPAASTSAGSLLPAFDSLPPAPAPTAASTPDSASDSESTSESASTSDSTSESTSESAA